MKRKLQYLITLCILMLSLLTGCAGSGISGSGADGSAQNSSVSALQDSRAESVGDSSHEDAAGEKTAGKETGGKETAGKETAEKGTAGKETAGKETAGKETAGKEATAKEIDEDGQYTAKDEVAAYLYTYGHLPDNFITKKEAKKLGWDSKKGNLSEAAPGKSIGGDYFGNYEGRLPEKDGREYHECDIDSDGGYRGAKRIVYSNDGLIYYTEDHYETFELLYGEE